MSQQENYDPDKSVKVRKALLGTVDFSLWSERLRKVCKMSEIES